MTRENSLSVRLRAIADLVEPGSRVADIGTDHAYLPIELVRSGKAAHALAMDIRKGPLSSAREHVEAAGLTQQIELRLSDGLAQMRSGEADTVIIAGMGGDLVIRILTEGADRLAGIDTLILSPHTRIREVRALLPETGFCVDREEMVCDAGKYYVIIRAVRQTDIPADPASYKDGVHPTGTAEAGLYRAAREYCGAYLLTHRHPLLRDWLLRQLQTFERIRTNLWDAGTGTRRTEEIDLELSIIRYALSLYDADEKRDA